MDLINLFKTNNNFIINPLNDFFPRGITKGSIIQIVGDVESGKTSFAYDIIKLNNDKIFMYIDTYFTATPPNLENIFLVRTNLENEIISIIENLPINSVDVLIIDSASNILLNDEENRITSFTDFFMKLATLLASKKISCILVNTLNGTGKPSNMSYQATFQLAASFFISCTFEEDKNIYNLTPLKSRYLNEDKKYIIMR